MVPTGELAIQTVAMPADTNPSGDIFGGWLVSQMDIAAGIMAKRVTQGRAVTIAIHTMTFLKPVHVGDLVLCYVQVVKKGRTSVNLAVEVWIEDLGKAQKTKVTEGIFVFVAIDEQGKSREFPK
jgi:acyl-CoA thioesterase YciA